MLRRPVLTHRRACTVASAATDRAEALNRPFAIAVVDNGGHLMYFGRHERVGFGSIDIAIAKARTAIAFQRDTHSMRLATREHLSYAALRDALLADGGYPIRYQGELIGAVGICAPPSDHDDEIAEYAARALAASA
jgi:glc operon protein GlcG